MSILIKGLKMPKGCLGCPCINAKYNECMILQRRAMDVMTRMTDCPLIELPDHGDLIDRDEAADDACLIWGRNSSGDDAAQEIIEHLREMKAVIPAERSEAEREIDKWGERSGTVDAERSEE